MDNTGHFFCTVALISSETLCSRFLRVPLSFALSHDIEQINIYSIAKHFSDTDRQRFIGALKCGRSFETAMTHGEKTVNIGLYRTNSFGTFWSHILILSAVYDEADIIPCEASVSSSHPQCASFLEALDALHKYNRLAADKWNTESPAVIKDYLDRANILGDQLTELVVNSPASSEKY